MSTLYYCTVVYDRWQTFAHLLESFLQMVAQPGHENVKLSVYDWNGAGKDIYPTWPASVIYTAGAERGPINRSAARNRSLSACQAVPEDLAFFVDCDMVLPLDFSERVCRCVKPGFAYFPVCYSLYRNAPMVVKGDGPPWLQGESSANGWWRESGRGNCGFTVADLMRVGGWDAERWGTGYGREDDDVFWRAVNTLAVHRERVPGFFHQWHPKKPEQQNPQLRRGNK